MSIHHSLLVLLCHTQWQVKKIVQTALSLLDKKFRRTTLLIAGSFAFLGGVLYAQYGSATWVWALPALFFLPALKDRRIVAFVIILYGGFILGLIRGSAALQSEADIRQYLGEKVVVEAIVKEDGYFDDKKRVVFTADIFHMQRPDEQDVTAPVRVNTFILASAARGDVVRIEGKLMPTLGNVAGSIGFAEVETIGTTAAFLDEVRRNFTAGLRNALPEPDASFAAGILIGQRSSLTQKWQDILRDAGLMHIIAVSGYNLTILVRFAKRALKKRSRYQVLLASGLLVTTFVLVTGLSPSILRALIVVILMQLTWFYGRKIHPFVLLGLAAAISVAIDPFQLWRSIGWYLSFVAFFGVIILAPLLIPRRFENSLFAALVAESAAAGLMTLPIIATVFGEVSLVGLLANLVVTPLVPFAMLLSFGAGLAGWFFPAASGWVGLPAQWLLTFMLDVANIVSRLPGARINLKLSTWQLAVFYGIVCLVIWMLYRHRRPKQFMLE